MIRRLVTRRRFQLLASLAIALLVFAITPKTPDSGWMGVYQAPAFPPLDTGIPVIRLWIPVEQLEYILFKTQFMTENLTFAAIYGWIIYVILRDAIEFRTLKRFALLFVPIIFAAFFAAWGGALYDAVFALGLVQSLRELERLKPNSGWKSVVMLGVWLAILDLSHPNALSYTVILFVVGIFRVRSVRLGFALIPLAIIALPWHVIEFVKYGSVTLTTYQGENLSEGFGWRGPFVALRNCLTELGVHRIDSRSFQDCAAGNQNSIMHILLTDPLSIRYVLVPDHVAGIIVPTPLWGAGLQISSPLGGAIATWVVRLGLLAVLIFGVIAMNKSFRYILGSAVLLFGFATTIVAHNGTESMRLIAPYYVVLFWMLMIARRKRRRDSAQVSQLDAAEKRKPSESVVART